MSRTWGKLPGLQGCCRGLALALLLIVGAPASGATISTGTDADTLVVIISPATGITDIPSSVLRSAYSGLRTEYKGVRLIPFNAPIDTPVRSRLDNVLLGLSQGEVGRFWVNQRVRDGRMPPRTVPSNDLAVRVVAQLRGAIACIPQSATSVHVTALRIDGKRPDDPGYLLAPK